MGLERGQRQRKSGEEEEAKKKKRSSALHDARPPPPTHTSESCETNSPIYVSAVPDIAILPCDVLPSGEGPELVPPSAGVVEDVGRPGVLGRWVEGEVLGPPGGGGGVKPEGTVVLSWVPEEGGGGWRTEEGRGGAARGKEGRDGV
jgi:hypothetical protein